MSRYLVVHSGYGCGTGCCGHFIEDEAGEQVSGSWSFDHPDYKTTDEERREWAQAMLREQFGDEHVADLDWDNCIVSAD